VSGAGELWADRYRLQERLGSGAMGVVWLATDELLQRPVAVKQLIAQPGAGDEARERAMREGRIAGRLHHPNVVAVHDVIEHDGMPVLVMEHVPSRSLAAAIAEQGPMSPETVAEIGAQAAHALAAAHKAGIVHRDVKPGNVLLGEDGAVKLTDFGISHAAGDITVTQTGLLNGTPAFLAPEIAQGHSPVPASDVFSLGATLYAAVEGRAPFGETAENSLAVLHEAASGAVPPPRLAGPLAPVLAQMMHSDPAQRVEPEHARELLESVAAGRTAPVAALVGAPDGPTQPVGAGTRTAAVPAAGAHGTWIEAAPAAPAQPGEPRGSRRRGRTAAAIAAVVAAALVAGVVLVIQLLPNQPQRPAASAITPAQLERVVSDYYALLPRHPDNSWDELSPRMRAGGFEQYRGNWAGISEVDVISPPRATGPRTVHIGVELQLPGGAKIREFHQFGFTAAGGNPLIDSDTVLHSETIAPPPPPPARAPQHKEHGDDEHDKKDEEKGKGEKGKKGEEN